MAVHGALIASASNSSQASGYLASVRSVMLHVTRLDDIDTDLIASADRVTGDNRSVLYEFSVFAAERVLLSGRATVVFDIASGRPIDL
jgi:predicted hotdog family 3-hydroxylacyl-ACP dehydratase